MATEKNNSNQIEETIKDQEQEEESGLAALIPDTNEQERLYESYKNNLASLREKNFNSAKIERQAWIDVFSQEVNNGNWEEESSMMKYFRELQDQPEGNLKTEEIADSLSELYKDYEFLTPEKILEKIGEYQDKIIKLKNEQVADIMARLKDISFGIKEAGDNVEAEKLESWRNELKEIIIQIDQLEEQMAEYEQNQSWSGQEREKDKPEKEDDRGEGSVSQRSAEGGINIHVHGTVHGDINVGGEVSRRREAKPEVYSEDPEIRSQKDEFMEQAGLFKNMMVSYEGKIYTVVDVVYKEKENKFMIVFKDAEGNYKKDDSFEKPEDYKDFKPVENIHGNNQETLKQEVISGEADKSRNMEDRKRRHLNLQTIYEKLKAAGMSDEDIEKNPEFNQALMAESEVVKASLSESLSELISKLKEQEKIENISDLCKKIASETGLTVAQVEEIYCAQQRVFDQIKEEAARKLTPGKKKLRLVQLVGGLGAIAVSVATGGVGAIGMAASYASYGVIGTRVADSLHVVVFGGRRRKKEL